MEWGFTDGSIRFFSADNEKVHFIIQQALQFADICSSLGYLNTFIRVIFQMRSLSTREHSSPRERIVLSLSGL